MLKEFKEFALKGNAIDMAVGIVIGAAFGTIVNSFVSDVLMPPIGLVLGKVDFSNLFVIIKPGAVAEPYASIAEAKKAGAITLNYGLFINTIISFLIIAFAIFIIVRAVNRMKAKAAILQSAPANKECPYCLSVIPVKATKCSHCTSDIKVI